MKKHSTLAKALYLTFALALIVPLLFGCAPTPTPVQPAATEAPAAEAPAAEAPAAEAPTAEAPAETEAPAAPTEPPAAAAPEKKTFVFGRYMDAITPDPVMNDANADL